MQEYVRIKEVQSIKIYTDGACSGNPGPGGWGVLVCKGTARYELAGAECITTNNRMELMAAIRALEHILHENYQEPIEIFSDSQYVVKGITEWIIAWQRNNWKTSQKKQVENKDLWEILLGLTQKTSLISWKWIRGHSGHPENEYVDNLARKKIIES